MTKTFPLAIILSLLGCTFSFPGIKTNLSVNPLLIEFEAGSLTNISNLSIADTLNAGHVWNNYINALGGVANLKKVRDRATIMESHINGQNITMTIYQKTPDKMKQVITTSSITQDIYFDGKEGIMKVGGKEIKITGSELEKLKYESMIDFIINIDSLGIKLKMAGIEKIDSKDCCKIEVLLPSGSKIIQYFDSKTWLKVKQVENVTAANKTFVQETYFNDYREVKGVKYPYSIKESLGAQSMDVNVTSIKVNVGLDDSFFVIK